MCIITRLALIAWSMAATWYHPSDYENVLYCTGRTPEELRQHGIPWVAVDVGQYKSGAVQCGDVIEVHFLETGQVLTAFALDAGPLEGYYIAPGLLHKTRWLEITVDIPRHLWPFPGRSAQVHVVNQSRRMEEKLQRIGGIP